MGDALKPDAALLCKLGSILVHADELRQPHGHAYDATALDGLLRDPDVIAWRAAMDSMAMLPKMRQGFERAPDAAHKPIKGHR